jgi:hypothetical protein
MNKIILIIVLLTTLACARGKILNDLNVGIGLEMPYGSFGTNINYMISRNNEVFVRYGTTILAGSAYNIGIRYYYVRRGRFALSYGTNGAIAISNKHISSNGNLETYNIVEETHYGINIELGYGDKRKGWQVDLIYILTSTIYERIDEIEKNEMSASNNLDADKIKLSLGYKF